MKMILLFVVVAIVLFVAVRAARSSVVPTYQVGVHQIPRVLAELSVSKSNPTFAVFMFSLPERPGAEDAYNLQFSIEGGHVGFDWVLLGEQNIEDQGRFLEFARAHGYSPEMKEMNGVRYLRVERGDLARLCARLITEMYRWPADKPIELLVEGFEWKP